MARRHRTPVDPQHHDERRHGDRRRTDAGAQGEGVLAGLSTDALTGLRSRSGLLAAAPGLLKHGGWAVLVDLDRFATVNLRYGHEVGDRVLSLCGAVLESVVVPLGGVVARLGADEFAVVVPDLGAHDVDVAVAGIVERLGVVEVEGRSIALGCSVGVSHGASGVGVEELLGEADVAMYRAKRFGRGRLSHFDDAERAALGWFREGTIGEHVDVVVRLQRSLSDRSMVGAMVAPQVCGAGVHLLQGEELRLLAEIAGRRFGLLDATLAGIARSNRRVPPAGLRLWFEIASADLVASGAGELWDRLSRIGLSGTPLGVELHGSGSEDLSLLTAAATELTEHGVHVALRATGVGAAGLAEVARVGAQRLVVDSSVVEGVAAGDDRSERTVRAVVDTATRFDAQVIASGVPSLGAGQLLRELGVDVAQVTLSEPWALPRPAVRPA